LKRGLGRVSGRRPEGGGNWGPGPEAEICAQGEKKPCVKKAFVGTQMRGFGGCLDHLVFFGRGGPDILVRVSGTILLAGWNGGGRVFQTTGMGFGEGGISKGGGQERGEGMARSEAHPWIL